MIDSGAFLEYAARMHTPVVDMGVSRSSYILLELNMNLTHLTIRFTYKILIQPVPRYSAINDRLYTSTGLIPNYTSVQY